LQADEPTIGGIVIASLFNKVFIGAFFCLALISFQGCNTERPENCLHINELLTILYCDVHSVAFPCEGKECGDGLAVSSADEIVAAAEFGDPITREQKVDQIATTVGQLLAGSNMALTKGDAIAAYAKTLKEVQILMYHAGNYPTIRTLLDDAKSKVQSAATALGNDPLGNDPDLVEIVSLLNAYRAKFN
jgi:hypothetical protein